MEKYTLKKLKERADSMHLAGIEFRRLKEPYNLKTSIWVGEEELPEEFECDWRIVGVAEFNQLCDDDITDIYGSDEYLILLVILPPFLTLQIDVSGIVGLQGENIADIAEQLRGIVGDASAVKIHGVYDEEGNVVPEDKYREFNAIFYEQ